MEDLATVIVLNELVDSDDEKPTRGKTIYKYYSGTIYKYYSGTDY